MQGERRELRTGEPAVQQEHERVPNQGGPDVVGPLTDVEVPVRQRAARLQRESAARARLGKPAPDQALGVLREYLAHRHRPGPDRRMPCREVGQRGADRRHRRPDGDRHAREHLRVAEVVGEAHHDLEPLAEVPGQDGRRVGARVRPRNRRLGRALDPDPAVAVLDIGEPVGVGDRARVRAQRLADPTRPGNRRQTGRRGVPHHDCGARQCLFAAPVVGERHLDLEPLADVRRHRRVRGRIRADRGDGLAVDPLPAVGVAHAGQAVDVRNRARVRGERLPGPRRPQDQRCTRRRRALHRHCGARQCLFAAPVVGERRLDPDLLAHVRGHHRVGGRVRADVGLGIAVDPEPAEGVAHVGQAVGVGDFTRIDGERVPGPRRPRDGRRTRRCVRLETPDPQPGSDVAKRVPLSVGVSAHAVVDRPVCQSLFVITPCGGPPRELGSAATVLLHFDEVFGVLFQLCVLGRIVRDGECVEPVLDGVGTVECEDLFAWVSAPALHELHRQSACPPGFLYPDLDGCDPGTRARSEFLYHTRVG